MREEEKERGKRREISFSSLSREQGHMRGREEMKARERKRKTERAPLSCAHKREREESEEIFLLVTEKFRRQSEGERGREKRREGKRRERERKNR